jgi:Fe-S-cluster containining protein
MQSSIGNAFVFGSEIKELEAVTGLSAEAFTETREPAHSVLKTSVSGCYFYSGGKCQIYDVRPFDCRLFPFDVYQRADGKLVWIVYNNICPERFDIAKYFLAAKELMRGMKLSRSQLELYTKKKSLSSEPGSFVELDPVDIDDMLME